MCVCASPRTPVEGVTVYGRQHANDVRQVQDFFEDRGVVYDYANIERDNSSRERMAVLSGQEENVVVEIGKKIFVGFEPAELERILP